jgi:hypothetical protein
MKNFVLWSVDNSLDTSPSSFKKWRSLKLQESDWMMLPDTPTISTEWANYRQSLRDIPTNAAYPMSLIDPQFIPLDPNGE